MDAKYCSPLCAGAYLTDLNRPQRYASTKAWQERNPDKMAAKRARHRKLRRDHHGCLTTENFSLIRIASDSRCVYCGAPGQHFDHLIPLAKGGANCVANIVFSCASCNLAKSARLPTEWGPASGTTAPVVCEAVRG